MAKDSNPVGHQQLPDDEDKETLGLYLTFEEAALLKISLSTLLHANMVPFERIHIIAKIEREAKQIAHELLPKQKPKIIIP